MDQIKTWTDVEIKLWFFYHQFLNTVTGPWFRNTKRRIEHGQTLSVAISFLPTFFWFFNLAYSANRILQTFICNPSNIFYTHRTILLWQSNFIFIGTQLISVFARMGIFPNTERKNVMLPFFAVTEKSQDTYYHTNES